MKSDPEIDSDPPFTGNEIATDLPNIISLPVSYPGDPRTVPAADIEKTATNAPLAELNLDPQAFPLEVLEPLPIRCLSA